MDGLEAQAGWSCFGTGIVEYCVSVLYRTLSRGWLACSYKTAIVFVFWLLLLHSFFPVFLLIFQFSFTHCCFQGEPQTDLQRPQLDEQSWRQLWEFYDRRLHLVGHQGRTVPPSRHPTLHWLRCWTLLRLTFLNIICRGTGMEKFWLENNFVPSSFDK